MAESLQVEVVTPERLLVNDAAAEIQIPGKTGYLGVLPGHAPLITELTSGEISYKKPGGGIERLAVHWGFAEVLPDKVTILAVVAEKAAEIDVARARQLRASAEALLREHPSGPEHERALRGLKQAETRLEVASKNDGYMANIVP